MPQTDAATVEDVSWADPALRDQLRRDPAAALRSLGLNPPDDAPAHAMVEAAKIMSMIWQDGRVIPKREFALSPDDEGLLFGRGVWESTRTFDRTPWLWKMHLDRMIHTARLLNIAVDPARLPDQQTVSRFVREMTGMDVIIRLNVSAGSFHRPGTVWMSAALPTPTMNSIRLQTIPNPVPKDQPYLVWKTFQYATRLRAGRQIGEGFDSTLLVDPDGHLLEAAHANLFVRTESGWATPEASRGGLLPGTVRNHLVRNAPVPIVEREIFKSELGSIHEAFLTNSNVGLVPVARIDQHAYPIGQETQRLARWLVPDPPPYGGSTTVSMS